MGLLEPTRPAAVLWDLDGTLVDSEPLWGVALDEVAEAMGRPLTAEVRREMVGTDSPTTMAILARHTGTPVTPAECDAIHEKVLRRVEGLLRDDLVVLPGAAETLRRVRAAGVPMALVTSSPRRLAELSLDRIGPELFDAVVTADDVTERKPAPEPYERAARLLGVAAAEAWAVEDSDSGAAAAAAAGCRVFLVPDATADGASGDATALTSLAQIAEWVAAPRH
ncbi:HAD family hydrolase [Marinitenerispora sediminis]|uniref:HAD family hydrolase n=1 Tax=Marinitenerispora sediminis TaxID=1931232 RepID=A0A368T3V4_9ACTN|nr:HAD family phosphatase [Marinitenerispora sediminis]RCV54096.1 HAD family hydrolase [Marinitenerispora sediminis]RCV56819.1 HAD family hydrolase [Marinitenerispora sediminis]RCV56942.1 HAD family hydrolase [Marinitenerispora sediminis]